MPSDITKTSDDIREGYKAPVMQQGRVILDRDFNSLQETLSGALEADALDIIGLAGTPDDGFSISVPESSPLTRLSDFLISSGTMYVGGLRAAFADPNPDQPPLSYFHQPDWVHPSDPFGGSPSTAVAEREFIYLHLFEQEISAIEDPDLKDVALGGPDTTQRLRLMRRVERIPVGFVECANAFKQANGVWIEKLGLKFVPQTMRLLPLAQLQVSFTQAPPISDPCNPVATGGYLGAENQLIRVQIGPSDRTGNPTLLWGYDNASFLYRIKKVDPDGETLHLSQSPVDAFHAPQAEQVVEVLRTAAVLDGIPDETDPAHLLNVVRCVADATGEVFTLKSGYHPSEGTVVLKQSLSGDALNDTTPLFLRVWQAQLPFVSPAGGAIELTDPVGQSAGTGPATTGLKVEITIPIVDGGRGAAPIGAYWQIAVRPGTSQAVYPERFLTSPQAPDGPEQWACPLAVIDWTGGTTESPPGSMKVTDCRKTFVNLVNRTESEELISEVFSLGTDGRETSVLNDGDTVFGNELALGLRARLTQDVMPSSATTAAVFLTLELPINIPNVANQIVGSQPVLLDANVVSSDSDAIDWIPLPGAGQFLANQLSLTLDGTSTFQRDWEAATSWKYGAGIAVNDLSHPQSGNSGVLAFSNSFLRDDAVSLSASVLPGGMASTTSVGIIFNASGPDDYWTFQLENVLEAGGGFVFESSTLVLNHVVNNVPTSEGTNLLLLQDGFFDPITINFQISQLPDQSLSFSATLILNDPPGSQFQLTSASAPRRLEKRSRVGLSSKDFDITRFTTLRIDYKEADSQVLLPPKLLSRLTIKRDLLRIADAQGKQSAPSRPDFSRWFFVSPSEPDSYSEASAHRRTFGMGTDLLKVEPALSPAKVPRRRRKRKTPVTP